MPEDKEFSPLRKWSVYRDIAGVTLLLLLGLMVRLEHWRNGLVDHESFRQGTEAMMARQFNRSGIYVQYPQIMGYGPGPRLWINEFPLYPATLALGYRFFGEHDFLGRFVTAGFSLATGFLCFLVLRLWFQNSIPFWGMAIFLFSPFGAYLGRCVLRHPMAFFFQILGFYLWLLWLRKPGWTKWVGTAISISLATLMNFPNAYIGLPMAVALVSERGWREVLKKKVLVLPPIILAPAILWLVHSIEFGATFLSASSGHIKQRDLGRFLRLEWVNASFFDHLWTWLWDLLLTPAGVILVILGIFLPWKNRGAWIVRAWLGAALLYLCVDHYPVYLNPHDYYVLHLLIPCALVGGIAAGTVVERLSRLFGSTRQAVVLLQVCLVVVCFFPWQQKYEKMRQKFFITEAGWNAHWIPAGKAIQESTPPGARVILDRAEDALMYYCDRPGWVNHPYDLTEEAIRSQIANGAEYLLLTLYKMEGNRFTGFHFDDPESPLYSPGSPWVRAHCSVIRDGSTYQIIDLTPEKHQEISACGEWGEPTNG